jgi:Zn-dependent protease with chaperone function
MLRFYAWPVCCFVLAGAIVWLAAAVALPVALVGGATLMLVFLAGYAASSRREETAADLYAIDLTGNLAAAAELMDVYVEMREAGRPRGQVRSFLDVWATHPEPEKRLAAMRRRIEP